MRGKRPIKLLVFSVSIGAGHDAAAQALAEQLLIEEPDSEVKIVDTFRHINTVLNKVVVGSYMETLRFTPKVWGYLYDQVEQGERLVEISQLLAKMLSPKLVLLIEEFNPDLIITTHAFPSGMLGEMKCRGQVDKLIAAVVTDFHIHPIWVNKGIDFYFIHSTEMAQPLKDKGIAPEKIKSVGIPLRRQFALRSSPQKFAEKNRPVVLVLGGGLGLGKMEAITRELLETAKFEVVVVAGKNKRLYETLQKWQEPHLHIYGYRQNMARLIAGCDLIVSKPGGITSAEVLAMGKPLVIYASLPGQEDRNAAYLLEKGVALRVNKLAELNQVLWDLWQNPLVLKKMQKKAQQLGRPQAAKMFWDLLQPVLSGKVKGSC